MPIDDLPGELSVPSRDGERDRWLRDYKFHDPTSETADGTQPFIEASTMADAMMPVYHDVKLCADASDPTKVGGALLKVQAESFGVTKPQATGGSGSVTCSASFGGGTIFAGDEATARGLRFKCIATALYNDGDFVPMQGVDTGPGTNLPAGTVLAWTTPRPGINSTAPVTQQPDGSGFTGGRAEATDEEYRLLWNQEKQNRPASGNDGEIQEVAEEASEFSVEKCFTYPCALGPSTTCIAFTLKPQSTGSSRVPNPTQIASVLASVRGQMPADEMIFGATVIPEEIDVVFSIEWDPGATGWRDLVTWPAYYSSTGQAIVVQATTDATHFILKTFNSNYSGVANPVAGKVIAFYDKANAAFRRKQILSVTGTGPWTIVCDTSNLASDESYVPVVGTRAMPWSDSLQDLVTPLATYFETLGPGEQLPAFFDDGMRQRRQPPSPRDWPSVITEIGLVGALDQAPSIFDVDVEEPTTPLAATVGTPCVDCYLQELGYIAAFPL